MSIKNSSDLDELLLGWDSTAYQVSKDPMHFSSSTNKTDPNAHHVLFLCTGNSARSIMAEAILNFRGRPNFTAYSAGSHPSGMVRPEALHQLQIARIPTTELRSKSWDEFAQPSAPKLDFIFTVCDNAAQEVCPIWPGHPMTAHWGVGDPAAVRGRKEDIERAFREAFFVLDRRIALFLALPLKTLDRLSLQRQLDQIGHTLAPVEHK